MAAVRRLGPSRSPVVPATMDKKLSEAKAESAISWGASCLLGAVLVGGDMYFQFLSYFGVIEQSLVWWAELCLLLFLLLCALYDVTLFITLLLAPGKILLTPHQKKLLRVSSTGLPLLGAQLTSGQPVHHAPGDSGKLLWTSLLVNTQGITLAERITDRRSLETYLRSEEDNETRLMCGSPDLTGSHGGWYGSQAGSDYTPPLRKYHMATNHSPLSREPDMVWSKLGFKRDELDHWTENCRKWLAQTVVKPVAMEIEGINETLCKIGSPELQIGKVTLGMVRKVARAKARHVQTLGMLIPYLELSSKQDYIVQRIKELSRGGYLSAYRWNAGGTWKGRTWDQNLPNDSEIVMHLLCTYLDSHMPPNPRFLNGRTFSSQYFLKYPEKPPAKKASYCIYQAEANPPLFKVLLKDSCIDLPKGRNNLFHAVVAFLHHIKTEEKSMLGPVNLELSGINILWIVSG